jgi:hypothetical protein
LHRNTTCTHKSHACSAPALTINTPLLPLLLLLLQLSARNTSLGAACNPSGGCAPSSYSSMMIAISVLLGSFALCLLQRHICWRCRVAGLMAEAQVGGCGYAVGCHNATLSCVEAA